MTSTHRSALLGDGTSRPNKLHLAISWKVAHPWHLEFKWQGEPMRSRLLFQFEPDGPWVTAKSFDEDVVPTFELMNPRQAKEA